MPLFNPSSSPVKASGAELDTATDDAKFATAKAIKDAHNVPSVAPGTSGNLLTSDGTDWTSAAPSGSSNLYGYIASDNLKVSADTERSEAGSVDTKVKEIKVTRSGVIRVKFDIKSSVSGQTCEGVVYKNGIKVGVERRQTTTSYVTYSEDFSVVANDLIQLYISDFDGGASTCFARNFRLYWDMSALPDYIINTD